MVNLRQSPDLLALALTGAVFLTASAWSIWSESDLRRVSAGVSEIVSSEVEVAPMAGSQTNMAETAWPALPLSADAEVWAFDVFTPPEIYFDPATGRFSVSAPEAVEMGDEVLQTPFGVTLVAVARQPYRLQLVGYAGLTDEPWGIFANEVTSEGIVAQPGFRFAGLGLELLSLEIKREDLIVPHSMPLREIVAVAQVRDEEANRTVRLTSGYPAWTERPKATVRIESTGEERQVEAGNRLDLADGLVEITGVFASPDAVTAVKLRPDGSRESIRLSPDIAEGVQFGGDTVFEIP